MGQIINFDSSTTSKPEKMALQKYKRENVIPVLNLGVWQVYQGVVLLSRICSNGNEVIVGFVTANATFERTTALSDVYSNITHSRI